MGPSSVSVALGTAMHMLKHTHTSPKLHSSYKPPAALPHSSWHESQQTGFALSSLHTFPWSCGVNLQNGKKTPRYTSLAEEATLGLIQVFRLVLWFSLPERVPALGFIHCAGWKNLIFIQTPMCSFSLLLLASLKAPHPEFIRLSPRRNLLSSKSESPCGKASSFSRWPAATGIILPTCAALTAFF